MKLIRLIIILIALPVIAAAWIVEMLHERKCVPFLDWQAVKNFINK